MKQLLMIFLSLTFSIGFYNSVYSTHPPFRDHNKFYHFLNAEILHYQTTGFGLGFSYSILSGKKVSGMAGFAPTFEPKLAYGFNLNSQIYPFLENTFSFNGGVWFTPKLKIPFTLKSNFNCLIQNKNKIYTYFPSIGYIIRSKKYFPHLEMYKKQFCMEISYGYHIIFNSNLFISPHQFNLSFFFIGNHLRFNPHLLLK